MTETVTPNDSSGGAPGGGDPTPAPPSGGTGEAPADASAFEARIAQLEAQSRGLQGALDRALAKLEQAGGTPDPTPTPPAPSGGLTLEQMRAELRRERELSSARDALKEQFPNATRTIAGFDSFESYEAMRVSAENEQKAFDAQVAPAVEAKVAEALKPYVDKFGPIQTPPAGGQPGAGDGLPTLEEIQAMGLGELEALEKEHPGLHQRLLNESLT